MWIYPLFVLCVQLIPSAVAGIVGLLLVAAVGVAGTRRNAAGYKTANMEQAKQLCLLCGFSALGHCAWVAFGQLLLQVGVTGIAGVILGRFGLFGYLLAFGVWHRFAPPKQGYLHAGDARAVIKFPAVWRGRQEPIWRFVLVFSVCCLTAAVLLAMRGAVMPQLLLAGAVFTLVNATLEEILWRGLILPRAVDLAGQKQALICTALAFGVYHVSLGFPLWACLVFAVGGFYMGGSAIVSKGLLAPWVMHVVVNFIFVFAGLIF